MKWCSLEQKDGSSLYSEHGPSRSCGPLLVKEWMLATGKISEAIRKQIALAGHEIQELSSPHLKLAVYQFPVAAITNYCKTQCPK